MSIITMNILDEHTPTSALAAAPALRQSTHLAETFGPVQRWYEPCSSSKGTKAHHPGT